VASIQKSTPQRQLRLGYGGTKPQATGALDLPASIVDLDHLNQLNMLCENHTPKAEYLLFFELHMLQDAHH